MACDIPLFPAETRETCKKNNTPWNQKLTSSPPLATTNLRRMQTYAIAWVDSTTKLRNRVDRVSCKNPTRNDCVGCKNPTWNRKLILEINSISTEGLKPPIANLQCMQSYAISYLKDIAAPSRLDSTVSPHSLEWILQSGTMI
uniref:Uncharacterized protein n=1 Tax=Nelumbo nucifera TaxID=4432 RepID=A0A822ZV61_NELNU|nr:TPA_asm: hypothetical protein HUJ06_017172 [Nelumbo nucifera]